MNGIKICRIGRSLAQRPISVTRTQQPMPLARQHALPIEPRRSLVASSPPLSNPAACKSHLGADAPDYTPGVATLVQRSDISAYSTDAVLTPTWLATSMTTPSPDGGGLQTVVTPRRCRFTTPVLSYPLGNLRMKGVNSDRPQRFHQPSPRRRCPVGTSEGVAGSVAAPTFATPR